MCATRLQDADLAGLDLSSWRLAFNGAEPVAAATSSASPGVSPLRPGPTALTPVPGLAESSVGLAFPPLGRGPRVDRIERRALVDRGEARPDADGLAVVAAGLPLPGHEIRVVDGDNRELPERRQGRVQFRGLPSTAGYYQNPAATAALVVGEWRNSGDLGYLAGANCSSPAARRISSSAAATTSTPGTGGSHRPPGRGAQRRRGGIRRQRPRAGTEKLVAVVETDLAGDAERAALATEVSRLAVELTGGPADDVVLAPARTVRKTSSGKIRRGSCRSLCEAANWCGRRRRAWRQFLRLGRAALAAGRAARRSASGRRSLPCAPGAGFVLLLAAPPVLLLPGLGLRRRLAREAARIGLALAGLAPASKATCPPAEPSASPTTPAISTPSSWPPSCRRPWLSSARPNWPALRRQRPAAPSGLPFRRPPGRHPGRRRRPAAWGRAAAAPRFCSSPKAPSAGRRGCGPSARCLRRCRGQQPGRSCRWSSPAPAALRDGSWRPRRHPIGVRFAAPSPAGASWEAALARRPPGRHPAHLDEPDLG